MLACCVGQASASLHRGNPLHEVMRDRIDKAHKFGDAVAHCVPLRHQFDLKFCHFSTEHILQCFTFYSLFKFIIRIFHHIV